jgi:hypothetical protein
MERTREYWIARHPMQGTLKFFDEEVANNHAGESGTVVRVPESFIFETIPEYLLFKENNKYFFEDAKSLKLSGFLTQRGSEILQKLISETSKEQVAFLLHRSITDFPMSQKLNNRLSKLQLFSLSSIIKIKDIKELQKYSRIDLVLALELIALVEANKLELGMVIPFNK